MVVASLPNEDSAEQRQGSNRHVNRQFFSFPTLAKLARTLKPSGDPKQTKVVTVLYGWGPHGLAGWRLERGLLRGRERAILVPPSEQKWLGEVACWIVGKRKTNRTRVLLLQRTNSLMICANANTNLGRTCGLFCVQQYEIFLQGPYIYLLVMSTEVPGIGQVVCGRLGFLTDAAKDQLLKAMGAKSKVLSWEVAQEFTERMTMLADETMATQGLPTNGARA
jgi:hypothetical protein